MKRREFTASLTSSALVLATRFGRVLGLAWLVLALVASGCSQGGDDERPTCLSAVDVDGCMPLYPPEFGVTYRNILSTTCASSGVSCHGPSGGQGGLRFGTEDEAYEALLGTNGGKRRVIPGDPKCSEIVVRLDSPGHAWSMPPMTPLDERARCTIRRWIAAGSPRSAQGVAP
jgi:cytochrome c